jgi:hypothetical protein
MQLYFVQSFAEVHPPPAGWPMSLKRGA